MASCTMNTLSLGGSALSTSSRIGRDCRRHSICRRPQQQPDAGVRQERRLCREVGELRRRRWRFQISLCGCSERGRLHLCRGHRQRPDPEVHTAALTWAFPVPVSDCAIFRADMCPRGRGLPPFARRKKKGGGGPLLRPQTGMTYNALWAPSQ